MVVISKLWRRSPRSIGIFLKKSGVRRGHAFIEGSRIGVRDVIGLLQNGETVESLIASSFPELTRVQVYACLVYYEEHRGEIDLLVARQMAPP
jgi:uncharacterized protein (DUF433 family)